MNQSNEETLTVSGTGGDSLAARLDLPAGEPRAYALFAHCFACGKDSAAAREVTRTLTDHGFAVLRFDFTGLGQSDGDFAATTFSSNITDLVHVADHLREQRAAPSLLIGHSLGGAAVIAAAERIPEIQAVATIGAPYAPEHVTHLLADDLAEIESVGEAEVTLGGSTFRVGRDFLTDITEQRQHDRIAALTRPLLILHAPQDTLVDIANARQLFDTAPDPKSFMDLDGADHLLTRGNDARFAGEVIATWAWRHTTPPSNGHDESPTARSVRVTETGAGKFTQRITTGSHTWAADEPESSGGTDSAPDPYQLLLSALGACTSMTLRMYADRKGWDLRHTTVTLNHDRMHARDCDNCETTDGRLDRIVREVHIDGDLDEEQRAKLLTIANKCPVHRTLQSEIVIETDEV